MIRLIYCEMLGHDCSFAYMKAVEYAANPNELIKRLGYMAAAICIPPDHDFRMMIVNQMCQDMQSKSQLNSLTGLAACRTLCVNSFIAILQPPVLKLLASKEELIRKKAVMCLHRFLQLEPTALESCQTEIRKALCDSDPSVMGATLNIIYDLAKIDPVPQKDLIQSLVKILSQIREHKLPADYDYHRIPAPWVQIQILRIFGLLGAADQTSSEKMYPILSMCIKRSEVESNIADAIQYESIRTICKIYPNDTLLKSAAEAIARFLSSKNNNSKYLGINSLSYIVKDNPQYVANHQSTIMDSLEEKDDSLKLRAFDLLFQMCNSNNLNVIVERMLNYLQQSTDEFIRKDIVQRIADMAERFSPDPSWYITTMTQLFQLGGNTLTIDLANNMLSILANGVGDDETDVKLRTDAATAYLQLLDKPKLPTVVEELTAWIVGEYGHLAYENSASVAIEKICDLYDREGNDNVKGYCLTALAKLVVSNGGETERLRELLTRLLSVQNVDLQQRVVLIEGILANMSQAISALTPGITNEVSVDKKLSFCDNYVQTLRDAGAKEYEAPAILDLEDEEKQAELNFDAYAKPDVPIPMNAPINRHIAVKEGQVTMKSISEAKRQQNVQKGISKEKAVPVLREPAAPRQRNAGFGSKAGTFSLQALQQPAAAAPAAVPETSQDGVVDPYADQGYDDNAGEVDPYADTYNEPTVDQREQDAAALFGGVSTPPKKKVVKKIVKKVVKKVPAGGAAKPAAAAPAAAAPAAAAPAAPAAADPFEFNFF